MERHFDEELADLKKDLLAMSALVEEAIHKSVEALKELDVSAAQQVIANDKVIDENELTVEERCINMFALRQPVAVDLRFVMMAVKISTDLERMADLAVDIAQRVLDLTGKPLLKPLIDIPKLTELAERMTREAINAFVENDPELAKRVILLDSDADHLRNLIQKELVDDYMAKDPATAPRAMPLLLIARHLERICDHATNIAEDVIYLVKARIVKHHPEKLTES